MKYLALFFALLFAAPSDSYAQDAVRGNGSIVNQIRPLDRFSSVNLDFVAEVSIVVGASPGIEIITDDNILAHIGTRINGGTLLITQERWIKPSQKASINITTPMLASLVTSGYSTVHVEGVFGPRFSIDAGVGQVTAVGSVDRIRLRTKTGTIDASAVDAKAAEVTIESWGKVLVSASERLDTDVAERATVVYNGRPAIMEENPQLVEMTQYSPEPVATPERVSFHIRNNRARRMNFEVQGPEGARFSYGFPIRALGSRPEEWPVGTQVFSVSRLGARQLLYIVAATDSGKTVNLFDS